MAVVNYGVIGCGAIGQRRHIPEIVANPDAKLVAVCDVNKGRVEGVAKQLGGKAYTDYKKLLKHPKLDAVVVCTPNALHAPMTIDALNAGKHVLVEKPMAGTREEARAMIRAAEKNKRWLMVGQNQRLMAPHVKAKEVLDSGKLGRVLSFRTTFKHPGPDGWSVDGGRSWFFKKDQAVMGVTGDLGVHKADLLRWLLGEEFAEVCGFVGTVDKRDPKGNFIEVDDNAYISLKTASGAIGSMMISWTNYGRREDNFTTLFCENGVIYMGDDPKFGVTVAYKDGTKEYHEVGAIATNTKQVSSGITDAFTRSILEGRKPEIDGEEGYRSLEVILCAMEAAEGGRTVRIGG